MGTTAAALRAGVPAIIVPFFADQPFWGRRLAHLHLAPPPIPQQQLTAERLAAAIRTAMGDRDLRGRVRAIGNLIQAEDGVARAVEAIHQFIN
ncbi:MAG: hypothetical protein EBE86_018745 [Hormoscilla sp. GUM202]|nr:hypothetical protein [Hormoscilla sp. GUM202]